jgi:hypothetical protein
MENINDNDIKLTISGHTKMYHNGELFFDKPNTVTLHTKRYLIDSFYIDNNLSPNENKLRGPLEATVASHQGGNTFVSNVPAAQLNVNRINPLGATTPDINNKAGILISKNNATDAITLQNVINAMNTSVEIINTDSPKGRRIKFTGTFEKTDLNGDVVFKGAAIGFSIKTLTGGPTNANTSPNDKNVNDPTNYGTYALVYEWLQLNGDSRDVLEPYNTERLIRPIAYQNFNRELKTGDTLKIDWIITIN